MGVLEEHEATRPADRNLTTGVVLHAAVPYDLLVWLLTLALRRNRVAVRHGLWLAASLKFLVPFSWLVDAAGRFHWRIPLDTAPAQLPAAL